MEADEAPERQLRRLTDATRKEIPMEAAIDTIVDPPVHRFLSRARAHPPLAGDQERAVIERLGAGDPEAVDELIDANLRLVASTILLDGPLRPDLELRDLCDEGTVALVAAVRQYEPDRHGPFRLHAVRHIRRAVIAPRA